MSILHQGSYLLLIPMHCRPLQLFRGCCWTGRPQRCPRKVVGLKRVPTLPDPVIPWLLFPTSLLWKEPGAPESLCCIPTLNRMRWLDGITTQWTRVWANRPVASQGKGWVFLTWERWVQPQIRPGRVLRLMTFHMPMKPEKSLPMALASSL